MIKQRTRTTIKPYTVDDIWYLWKVIISNQSRTSRKITELKQFEEIATIIGCSSITVRRIIRACEQAQRGEIVSSNPGKLTNMELIDYINEHYFVEKPKSLEVAKDQKSNSDAQKDEVAKSLRAAISALTDLLSAFETYYKN